MLHVMAGIGDVDAAEIGNAPAATLKLARIVAEAEEETGFRVTRVEPVFTVFMSPGSVTEKLYFFIAEYQADDRRGDGGGLAAEGEDIEVLEWPLTRALQAIRDGEIMDAKTIILLQHLALNADTLLAG